MRARLEQLRVQMQPLEPSAAQRVAWRDQVVAHGDANEFNQQLTSAIQRDGRIFLSSTMIEGVFTLRLAILSAHTHVDTIDLAIDLLRHKASELTGQT